MVGMPDFLARFLTRFLARFLTRVFGQGFLDRKYSVQFYWDGEIQFYSTFLILTVEISNPNSRDF